MAKFISHSNPISTRSLKRRELGAVVRHHNAREDVKFTRVEGGWVRERTDVNWVRSEVVSSAAVADECNRSVGCSDSWAKVY